MVSNEAREDFEREVEIMIAFDHDNILKLLGIVSEVSIGLKSWSEGVSSLGRQVFEREVEIMSAFDHHNVFKLLEIVSESKYRAPNMPN